MMKNIFVFASFFALIPFVTAENIAPLALASASSTYCYGTNPSANCYDAKRVNDGSVSTTLGGFSSWANARSPSLPQTWQALWPSYVKISSAKVYTSTGYPIQDFDLQYYNPYYSQWITLAPVRGNTDLVISMSFASVYTDRIRVMAYKGPTNQTIHVRLNEIVVEGDAQFL